MLGLPSRTAWMRGMPPGDPMPEAALPKGVPSTPRWLPSAGRGARPGTQLALSVGVHALLAAAAFAVAPVPSQPAHLPGGEVALLFEAPPGPAAAAPGTPVQPDSAPAPQEPPPVSAAEQHAKPRPHPPPRPPKPAKSTLSRPAPNVAALPPGKPAASAGTSQGTATTAGLPGAAGAATGTGGVANSPVGLGNNQNPAYPQASRRVGEQGTVVLRVTVGTDGRPVDVAIAKSSGSARLDEAAANKVRAGWRFVPATRDALPVESVVLLPISFRLED